MAAEKRPIDIADLYKINSVEDPQISPDGKWIAYIRVTLDKMENGYKRNIWLSPVGEGEPRQLTRSGKDFLPHWSPDGKTLAFTSARDGKPQIYLLPVEAPGGEPRSLTSAKNGASGFSWSSDGKYIAYISSMDANEREKEDRDEKEEPPQDKLEGKHRKERQDEDEKKRYDPYRVWRVPFRQGTTFIDGRFSQVYVIATSEGQKAEDSKPRRLTNIDADFEPPMWSPDGKYIYTSHQFNITDDEPFRQNVLYRISIVDGAITQISDPDFSSFSPVPSPDGKWIVFARLPRLDHGLTEANLRLSIMPVDGGEVRDLNIELDRSLMSMEWSSDNKSLIFNAGDNGNAPIYRVDVESGKTEIVTTGRFKSLGLNVNSTGIAFTASTPTTLVELYWLPSGESEFTQKTHFNKEFLEEVIVQETHEFRFKNKSGQEIQGWYILPVSYKEGVKYPLAVNIHGGPHVMWGPSEASMFHEWQLHAARGYAVFYCNPRGGDGYGEAFQKSLHAAWGDVAFEDIMAGVDAFLEKGIADESRMAVTGGSYGGYMTAWIVGHTDRFACGVTQRGVYNLISFYGTSDVPSLISGEFDVHPWEDHELLWKHSPLAYAKNMKTPLLILHSENDYRVPIEQAEQLFAFVRRSGGTTELIRFPRDGHELSRSGEPEHRVLRLTHMINWFDKYCITDKTKN